MVRKTVIADDMTLFFHPLQNDFITRNAVANAKKSGFYIRLPEYIQDFGRMCRGRTVIKRDGDLLFICCCPAGDPDKKPGADISRMIEQPVVDHHILLTNTSSNFRFAAAVAQFGMLLRQSEFKQQSTYGNVLALASSAIADDAEGYRKEFIQLVQKANSIVKADNQIEEESIGKR